MFKFILRIGILVVAAAAGSLALNAAQGGATRAGAPTFSRDVAPILFKNCAACHRPGQMAPMSLLTYEDARPFARAIGENVAKGTMPPWHADPAHGRFANDRSLSAQDKDVIARWVAAGATKGDTKDLPAAPTYAEGWTIGPPDAIVPIPKDFAVAADGEIKYQYFEAPTSFTEDTWVQAMEVRPGNRAVVHHVLVFAREPKPEFREPVTRSILVSPAVSAALVERLRAAATAAEARQGAGVGRGVLIATTAPGMNATVFEPGTAMLIKAGSVVSFQIHYTTNGTAATDRTSIGFVFAKQSPKVEVRATAFTNGRFVIPPGAANHPVESGVEFLEDVTVYSIFPHTHLRGRSWEYQLVHPDGRSEVILSVPKYDFNWQTDYVFEKPLKLPKGTVLKALAHYDNSASNPANPDPKAEVRWGDQTWEEMQYTGINFSVTPRSTTDERRR